jgi:hypothetical protein
LAPAEVPAVMGAVVGLAEVLGSLAGAALLGPGFAEAAAIGDPVLHSSINTIFVFPLAWIEGLFAFHCCSHAFAETFDPVLAGVVFAGAVAVGPTPRHSAMKSFFFFPLAWMEVFSDFQRYSHAFAVCWASAGTRDRDTNPAINAMPIARRL